MKVMFLVVGKTVDKRLVSLVDEYAERVKHYVPFTMEVIPDLKNTKALSFEQQKEREGELILKALKPDDYVVLLDEGYLADIALIYSMISFLAVIILSKVYTGIYYERKQEEALQAAAAAEESAAAQEEAEA